MELGELRLALRRDFLDDAKGYDLYSDEALNGFINDAQRQVCLRARALVDSTSAGITEYTIPAGQRRAQLHPSILAVRNARLSNCRDLRGITAKRLWKCEPQWDVAEAGPASYWVPDYQDGWLYFDRPVETESVLRLSVWRMPTELEKLEDDGDEPVISEHWHIDLLDWAAYRAYSLKDSETYDEKRAANHLSVFEAKIGRLPSMTEVRLWGISPIVGVPAEFI